MPARDLGLSAGHTAASFPFAIETPAPVADLLAAAAACHGDTTRAAALLEAAQRADPLCLPVYFARCKFYFYRNRLADAERAVLDGLGVAAARAGFDADWTRLTRDTADWSQTTGPVRFYLFSLKALAFIRLRARRATEARAVLAKLAELDPADRVGGSVIDSLAAEIR